MAAVAAMCSLRCTRRLYVIRVLQTTSRFFSAESPQTKNETTEQGTSVDGKPARDPLAVLKALALTVEPTALAPPKELYEDIYLLPRTPRKRVRRYIGTAIEGLCGKKGEECKAARISGLKAAEYVINKYPQLFPMRKPVPAWPDPEPMVVSVETEEDLKSLISKINPKGAIVGYERLLELGIPVSLETQNDLLDLVAFFGDSCSPTEEGLLAADEGTSSSSDSDSSDSESDERIEVREGWENTWRMDNYAEKLFSTMEKKNGRTYEAMILALLKHNFHERAFDLFEEMRKQGHQANIHTYTTLFSKTILQYGRGTRLWTAIEDLIGEMKKDPAVLPTLGIYNEILKLCGFVPEGSDKALKVFRDMHDKGIEPSLGSFSLLIRAEYYLKRTRAIDAGIDPTTIERPNNSLLQNIISSLEKLGTLPDIQSSSDVKFFNTAIGSALHCRDANAAHRLLALAHTNPTKYLGPKRGQFYASFLSTLARSDENPELVYRMYQELVPSKLIPQPWVYTELLRLAERAKLPRLVPKFHDDMKRYRVPVNQNCCRGIFSALSKKTHPKHYKEYAQIMEDVFYFMKKFEIPIDTFMVSQLVRQYCLGGQLEQAWNAFEMFKELNFIPSFTALSQLLDCCRIRRDKEQAIIVFEMLAKQGYHVDMRKRSNAFDHTHMTLTERLRINKLFEDNEKLEDRREFVRKRHTLEQTEDAEVDV